MIYPVASLYQSWSKFLLLISFLKLITHNHVLLLGCHGGSFYHLRVCWMILVFWNLFFQSCNVFCDLIKVFYTQGHNSLETPKYIGVNEVAVKKNVHYLIVTQLLCLLNCIDLVTIVWFILLRKKDKYDDCQHFIHALSVPKLIVVFCP